MTRARKGIRGSTLIRHPIGWREVNNVVLGHSLAFARIAVDQLGA